jgi:hypothetical protein
MANTVRVVNRQNQVLNLLLRSKDGKKVETKSLLPRQSLEIEAGLLSEHVFDLNRRGHVVLTKVSPAPESKKVESKKKADPVNAAKVAKFEFPSR